jgi:hypothetical protein
MFVELLRLFALTLAAMFVLITITNSFLELPLAGSFDSTTSLSCGGIQFRVSADFPTGLFWPPVAIVDDVIIGSNRQDFSE